MQIRTLTDGGTERDHIRSSRTPTTILAPLHLLARRWIPLLATIALLSGCGGQVGDDAGAAQQKPVVRWGAWIDRHRTGTQPPWDMRPVGQLERSVGKRMSLVAFSTPFADSSGRNYFAFPRAQLDAVVRHHATPVFSWGSHAMRNYGNQDFTLSAIADGRQDAYIERWARAAQAWGRTLLLRFDWEMNGDWFPWSEGYGDQPAGSFVRAWKHVHAIFARAGSRNVRWVWCPNADPQHEDQPLASLYPGDDEVDWTCADVYNRDAPWVSAADQLGPTYDEITRTIAPGKPMLLGEVGSTEAGGSKAGWISDLFAALPTRFPAVRALTWFDATDPGSSTHRDWPLDSSKSATAAFAKGIASDRYIGAKID